MKEFLEYLIKSIVTKPDEVTVTETQEEDHYFYLISVAQEDMGIVIGREGKNIKGIRNMAKAKAIKDGIMVRVELEDKKKPESSMEEDEETVE
jgi:predicted RNA-binding protein YlqC (UPF0109 family)